MNIRRTTLVFYGVRHLLGGRLWTPPGSDDSPELLYLWHRQQEVAWCLARILAWAALLQLLQLLLSLLVSG